jgi:hypothetical protein
VSKLIIQSVNLISVPWISKCLYTKFSKQPFFKASLNHLSVSITWPVNKQTGLLQNELLSYKNSLGYVSLLCLVNPPEALSLLQFFFLTSFGRK